MSLVDVAKYFYADEDAQEDSLIQDLRQAKADHDRNLQDLDTARARIPVLLKKIEQARSRLDRDAMLLLERGPETLARRSASHALLATQIEMNLLKLAVLRARAWKEIYSDQGGDSSKIASSHARLLASHDTMRSELDEIDGALAEYEQVLSLMGSEYKQIVTDFARVQRETEECKRDLRRLGWGE